jgi:hypothetical protein
VPRREILCMALEVKKSNFKPLYMERVTTLSTSGGVRIFANAPKETEEIWLTVRSQGITLSMLDAASSSPYMANGVAPTANQVGLDFGPNTTQAPYVLPFSYSTAIKMLAIEQAASAEVYIVYVARESK